MKKCTALCAALLLCLSLPAGCGAPKETPLQVFSFHGEGDGLSVANGVIVLSEGYEVFQGGDLTMPDTEKVTGFTGTFYVEKDGEKTVLSSNAVVDRTGGNVVLGGELGSISGESICPEALTGEDLCGGLYFELVTVGTDGKEMTFCIPLTVKEVTDTQN